MKEIALSNFVSFHEAVTIVCCCCCSVVGGVCGSCCFSPITGLFDEDELTGLVVEPFHEELVGVVVVVVVFVGSGVEGFYIEKGPLVFFSQIFKIYYRFQYFIENQIVHCLTRDDFSKFIKLDHRMGVRKTTNWPTDFFKNFPSTNDIQWEISIQLTFLYYWP